MPEYALTLHFGAPDEATARKRADDIADLAAAEHGTRSPIVVPVDGELRKRVEDAFGPAMRMGLQGAELFDEPGAQRINEWIESITTWVLAVVAPELDRLRGELAATELNRDMARAGAEGLRRELKATLQRAEQAEDRLRKATSAYTRLSAQADDAAAARDRWRKRGKQAEDAAAEWQAACEAHQADGEALMAAIERVRAFHIRNANTGDCEHCSERDYPDYAVPWPCPTIATLDAPSGADSPASGRTGVPRHTETTREAGEAQEAAE